MLPNCIMEAWRQRLLDAVDRDPRSDRAISLATGLGVNAVNELRNTAKKPSVEKVLKIANEVNASLAFIFLDIEISPDEEAFLKLLGGADPDVRSSVETLLRRGKKTPAIP